MAGALLATETTRSGQLALIQTLKEIRMNKHQVTGRAEEAKGKIKEGAGKAVGNERLTAEGQVDQAVGKTKATAGDVKDKVQKTLNDKR
jgi:uncharacterized protein YjbJ (UPF0337 family)